VDGLAGPRRLSPPPAVGGGPHAVDRPLLGEYQVLDVLGDRPLAGVGLEDALGRRQGADAVEQPRPGLSRLGDEPRDVAWPRRHGASSMGPPPYSIRRGPATRWRPAVDSSGR